MTIRWLLYWKFKNDFIYIHTRKEKKKKKKKQWYDQKVRKRRGIKVT